MNTIDRLVRKLSPQGVPRKALAELGTFTRGGGPQKKDFIDAGTGCIHYGQIYTHYGISAEETNVFVAPEVASRSRTAAPGDVVIAVTGENDEDLGKAVAWLGDSPVAVSNHTLIFTSVLVPKFVSYFLQSTSFHQQKQRYITGTKVRSLPAKGLGSIRIPVPPLEVQQEIVRILDKFTELEAELEAELDARHKQYEHYLNSLTHPFSEDRILKPGWTEAKMGDLCRIEKGRTAIQKAVPGPYPLVTTARDRGTAADFQFDGDAACIPLISSRGHGFASIARIYHQSGRFALGNILAAALPYDSNTLSAEFLRAYLQSRKDFILVPLMRGGANVSLTIDSLKRLKVHFPSIDEQRRIVQILRKFESLIGDSPFGIPAEIAARRKQYEYYRDRLLSFEELSA